MFNDGLAAVCSFLIVFLSYTKIDVWGFRAKGGELSHYNTNRLTERIFPNSENLSFLSWDKKKVGFSVRKSSHLMPLASCYVHGSHLCVAHYPTRLQRYVKFWKPPKLFGKKLRKRAKCPTKQDIKRGKPYDFPRIRTYKLCRLRRPKQLEFC